MATTLFEELKTEGKIEGKSEGEAKAIITFLEARFGAVPMSIKDTVTACMDLAKLDALTRLAATCGSIDEFKRGLK